MTTLPTIRQLLLPELTFEFSKLGFAAFRARQVYDWIWRKGATTFEQMTDLPVKLRQQLTETFLFPFVSVKSVETASDRTRKYLFSLHDGKVIEGVLIPSIHRNTICISSQVGCQLACTFCATGQLGFSRNLTFDEIFDQVRILNDECMSLFGKKVTNIVLMGMGEPLLNYEEVMKALTMITKPDSLGFSPQRITISTAGIPDKIKQLGKEKLKYNLAVSLNAATDEKRNRIMPINRSQPLAKLYEAMKFYQKQTREIITLEYILLKGFNDTYSDVRALADFTKGLKVKLNLIEYNPVENVDFKRSSFNNLTYFKTLLEEYHFIVNIRNSRGKDISAACGQLAGKNVKDKKENLT